MFRARISRSSAAVHRQIGGIPGAPTQAIILSSRGGGQGHQKSPWDSETGEWNYINSQTNDVLNTVTVCLHFAMLDYIVPFGRIVGLRSSRHESVGRSSTRSGRCDSSFAT